MSVMSLIGGVLKPVFGIIDKAVKDKDLAAELKNKLQTEGLELIGKELEAQTSIIVAEAQGGSWLQRSWRPITMLFFTGCIGAHWFGFTPDNLTAAEVNSLLELVKIGMGGYVVGRSAEKVAKVWKEK